LYSISPLVTRAESLSEKAESLAENLVAQIQPVTDSSVPAVVETVHLELKSYFLSPAGELHLTTPDEVYEGNGDLKFSKAPGPNGIPNRELKHLPRRSVSLLVRIFNAVLRTHHFPQTCKHA